MFAINFRHLFLYFFFFFFIVFVSFVVGVASAFQLTKFLIVIFGGLLGVLLLALSAETILIVIFVLSFFLVGQIYYFGGIVQAPWIAYGLGLVLFLKILPVYFSDSLSKEKIPIPNLIPVLFFFAAVLISLIVNLIPLVQAIIGLKNTLFMWSVFFIVALGGLSLVNINNLWKKYYWLVLFQIPLVLYQALIVVPERASSSIGPTSHWDAIVGGFGGDPMAGGASSALALFIVIGLVYYSSLRKRNLISKIHYYSIIVASLMILFLAEVKVVVVLIPIAIFILYRKYFVKNPVHFFMIIAGMIILLFSILAGYQYQKTKDLRSVTDFDAIYETTFANELDTSYTREKTGEIGRATSLVHWWAETGFNDMVHTLFGYGPGATRASGLSVGEIAQRYYYYSNIARATSAQLLWEIGLVGFIIFVFVLIRAISLFSRALSWEGLNEWQKSNVETSLIACILLIVTIPHSRDILEIPSVTLFTVFLIGYASYLTRCISISHK